MPIINYFPILPLFLEQAFREHAPAVPGNSENISPRFPRFYGQKIPPLYRSGILWHIFLSVPHMK